MCGFIAQLVEHRTGIRGGHGFESRWSPEFFQASFPQLNKLVSSRWGSCSFLILSIVQNNLIYSFIDYSCWNYGSLPRIINFLSVK